MPKDGAKERLGTITRKTKETSVSVTVNLDGRGVYDVSTGIGFFDHMLEQLSKHALIDLTIVCEGDLHIDGHHTAEDVGITLGQAIKQAVGDKKGIRRYGHMTLVMDEARSSVVLDLSNRPYLFWDVDFTVDRLGEMDTELFEHWFHSISQAAGITLHVEQLYGENNHHICEGIYKGFARAMRQAVSLDPRKGGAIPSTKGQLGG